MAEAMALKRLRAAFDMEEAEGLQGTGSKGDEVLDEPMKTVPTEVVSTRIIREHEERMRPRHGRH